MKKVFFILFALLSFFALLIPTGCGDKNDEDISLLEPAQRILGQWQEIARGNDTFPELEPDGHIIEFLPDGTMPDGTYHSGSFTLGRIGTKTATYRADAEFLYLNSGKPEIEYIYRYSFTGTNTLRLDIVKGMVHYSTNTPSFNIYKRIKNK